MKSIYDSKQSELPDPCTAQQVAEQISELGTHIKGVIAVGPEFGSHKEAEDSLCPE